MRNLFLGLAFSVVVVAFAGDAGADNYPYDRSKTGCIQGDCFSGFGVYIYSDYDIYEGNWKNGKQHGAGTVYIVDNGPWSEVHKVSGTWVDGDKHGKFYYRFPSGSTHLQYWHRGEDVTALVEKCRTATTVSDAYQGFVAIVNGLFAAAEGRDVVDSAARGYDAAGDQMLPRGINLTCSQLLEEFE